uniref:Uncharacterized protein n=1 Tax=Romanomermis culicivorax TaxID=13658 RepID=A0A915L0M3_ROMCU
MESVNQTCPEALLDFVWSLFGHCISNYLELTSFFLGWLSLTIWLFPTLPQIFENYKSGHCDDALSIYFLLMCYVADYLSLFGAILSKQLPVQIYVGGYFILQDSIMIGQYFFYKGRRNWSKWRSEERVRRLRQVRRRKDSILLGVAVLAILIGENSVNGGVIEDFSGDSDARQNHFFGTEIEKIGYFIGLAANCLYFSSRFPQVWKNLRRQSTQGVSVHMFYLTVAANTTYGMSVILGGLNFRAILKHMPWLIGSLGCCFLDLTIIYQYFKFKNFVSVESSVALESSSSKTTLLRATSK